MTHIHALISLLFVLSVVNGFACRCSFADDFCASLRYDTAGQTTIFEGIVFESMSYKNNPLVDRPYIAVRVYQHWAGPLLITDTVYILGSNGAACLASIEHIEKDDTLMLALADVDDAAWSGMLTQQDYPLHGLSACSTTYLIRQGKRFLQSWDEWGQVLCPVRFVVNFNMIFDGFQGMSK